MTTPDFDFLSPEHLADPYPLYRRLYATEGLLRTDLVGGAWVAFRHVDVVEATRNPALKEIYNEAMGALSFTLAMPDHRRFREAAREAFSPLVMRRARVGIQADVDRLLDVAAARGRLELTEGLSAPLSAQTIARMIGVEPERYPEFRRWSDDLAAFIGSAQPSDDVYERASDAAFAMETYLLELLAAGRERPGDDIMSGLARQQATGLISEAEALGIAIFLVGAGHETTSDGIATGIRSLLKHPEQLAMLREDPLLLESAVEEMLRWESPIQWVSRVATEDTVLAGQPIRRRQRVLLFLGAANRDPSVFRDPDRFDITRKSNHVAFAHGAFFCLGAPLARTEIQLSVQSAITRFPHLALESDAVEWAALSAFRTPAAIWVSVAPPASAPTLTPSRRPPHVGAQASCRLGEVLATGSVGQIHRAEDLALGREVAVKVLRPEHQGRSDVVDRFVAEARLAATLEHPNILPVYGVGWRAETGPFFVMKLVEGETLRKRLRARRRPPSGEELDPLIDALIKVCDALAFAHSRGLAHGDLTSRNVLLGRFGEVYLTDWGNARSFGAPAPRGPDGQLLTPGTLDVLTPEQARGLPLDRRTDVFGIGALIYEVLTRRAPYAIGSDAERIAAAAACRFPPIDEIAPRAHRKLAAVSARAMQRDPRERYPDIAALRRALDAVRRGRLPARPVRFPAGAVLMREGEIDDAMFMIRAGEVAILRESDGAPEEIRRLGPGAVVGEIGLLTGQPRTATVTALTDVVAVQIRPELVEQELDLVSPWMASLVRELAVRFRDSRR